jgi:hypothetical protein
LGANEHKEFGVMQAQIVVGKGTAWGARRFSTLPP